MDLRILALDSPLFLTHSAEVVSNPTRTNVRKAKARVATPVSGRDARGQLRDTGERLLDAGGCQGVPELLHLHCRHAGDEARRHQGSGEG